MPAREFSVTLPTEALKATVARACAVAPKRTTIPILGHALLQAEGAGLSITATDLDHQARASVEVDASGVGAITADAETLKSVTAKLPKSQVVTLHADPAKMAVRIMCGRARFVLPALDPDDFPNFAPEAIGQGFPHAIELAGKVLANVLKRARFAISTEETRYYLNGVYAHVVEVDGEPTLRLVATDGHRLARVDTHHATGLDPAMPGVIVPRGIVGEFIDLAEEADGAPVTLELSRSLARLTAGPVSLTSKLIDGTFPDYPRVIPQTFRREVVAPTLALIECLDRVRVMADDKVKGVRLAIEDGKVTVSLRRPLDLFEAQDEVDAELIGPPGLVEFNAKYLAEILAVTGGDTVRLKLNEGMEAATIGDRLAEALYVLMPLRPGSADPAAPTG